ncbi:glycoside hydrolase family 13 protein [Polaribacter litorisediminis]|uniref:glycoside hydrolase family 13 protein n=1 Tax=Polaribacter litorisediminis TaxID=1908341 RepID=UPI001CBE3674|nr:glycoside hydrolase family 13 protein [Polaribacter litorisediminis]UAM99164.1 glycoside hydrolase family 13 protein [Polaribacter litorisediminis]
MKLIQSIFLLFLIALFSCDSEKTIKNISEVSLSNTSLERVEPSNWWVNFKDTSLQLLVKEENIGNATPKISYAGVTIQKVNKAKSKNYLFIDLNIDKNTKPGKFDILFTFEDGSKRTHTYQLKERQKPAEAYKGFDSSDAIYLITPDRFSNGDETNDINKNLKETTIDRTDGYQRHGGDLQGIINHVDYIADLGFTAVWPTPVLTNDMPKGSYHGYAITDYYQVDPRFGTLEDYKKLADDLRKKGMKLIMDQVANHCGLEHWWMKDIPFDDWVNHQKNFEKNIENWTEKTNINSNHRRTTNQDRYASKIDKKGNNEGWFVATMPDLNQRNPFMAKYIIQNSIWWIETIGFGGIRQDTYPYPDKQFMSDWAGAIMQEYPNFSIVGEEWSYNPLLIGYWQKGANNRDGYESNLKSTMDFAMQQNVVAALKEEESWDNGLVKIYEGLANDFHYASPKDIMIFPDNHDMSRIYTQLNGNVAATKMALSIYLMLPRIPQIYYGTEILMDDFKNPGDHGLIRTDFPGGWKDDKTDAFSGNGLSDAQKDMQFFMTKVLNYRKNSKAIQEGKTIHFVPFQGTYFLFRILEDEVVVHVINKNDQPITIDLGRYSEIGLQGKTLKNIITDENFIWNQEITLSGKGSFMFTTKI